LHTVHNHQYAFLRDPAERLQWRSFRPHVDSSLAPILILLGGVFALLLCRAARFVHYDAVASTTAGALAAMMLLAIPDLPV
jgi:uncharacterized membrane protein